LFRAQRLRRLVLSRLQLFLKPHLRAQALFQSELLVLVALSGFLVRRGLQSFSSSGP
jgi:hypothetical protein